jgi:hypothetical protein
MVPTVCDTSQSRSLSVWDHLYLLFHMLGHRNPRCLMCRIAYYQAGEESWLYYISTVVVLVTLVFIWR